MANESSQHPTSEVYVVVCSDLHAAFGPFTTLRDAVTVARAETDRGECTFLPVPMMLNLGVARIETPDTPAPPTHKHGGYL